MTINNKTWRQHYIPQWYQKFFADNSMVLEFNCKTKKIKKKSVKSVNFGTFFYSNNEDDTNEKILALDDEKMFKHLKKIKSSLELNVLFKIKIEAQDEIFLKRLVLLPMIRKLLVEILKKEFKTMQDEKILGTMKAIENELLKKMHYENWNIEIIRKFENTFGYTTLPLVFGNDKNKEIPYSAFCYPLSPKILIFYYNQSFLRDNSFVYNLTTNIFDKEIAELYERHCKGLAKIYFHPNIKESVLKYYKS